MEENVGISMIYRVSEDVDTIFCGEKSEKRKIAKNWQKIVDISSINQHQEINLQFNGKVGPNGRKLSIFQRFFNDK